MNPFLLKATEVTKMVGLSYPTFHELEKEGKFPRRVQITERRIGWRFADIEKWVNPTTQLTFL